MEPYIEDTGHSIFMVFFSPIIYAVAFQVILLFVTWPIPRLRSKYTEYWDKVLELPELKKGLAYWIIGVPVAIIFGDFTHHLMVVIRSL